MSATNATEEVFDQIRGLVDELGLEVKAYERTPDADERVLADILGEPVDVQKSHRRELVAGLGVLAAAASVVTVLAVGSDGGGEEPSAGALSATLAAPSVSPPAEKLDSQRAGESFSASGLSPLSAKSGIPILTSFDQLVGLSRHVVVVDDNTPAVVLRTITGRDLTSRSIVIEGQGTALVLHPGLRYTGKQVYFLIDGPGSTYAPIVPPYAETSPGVYVSTAATLPTMRRLTEQQLTDAAKTRR